MIKKRVSQKNLSIEKKKTSSVKAKIMNGVHSAKQEVSVSQSIAFRGAKRFAKRALKKTLLSPVFHSSIRVASLTLFIASLGALSYFFINKTFANEVIVSQSEIISRAGKLVPLPSGAPDEVVRVQDEENLRLQNPFYHDVKEGDYILIYNNMAVIYDLRNNVVKGVKR